MSTQSIIHNSTQTLSDNTDKVFIRMGDDYLLKKKFGVGSGYDRDEFIRLKWLDRLLCSNSCHTSCLKSRIKEKISTINIKNL